MFSFMGFDFMFDETALDPPINNIEPDSVTLRHSIVDHFHVDRNVTNSWTGIIPTEWTVDTIMNCSFEGTINSGNMGFLAGQLTGVRIKRRKATDFAEDNNAWTTLFNIPIDNHLDLDFTVIDRFNQFGVEYVYGLYPIIRQEQSGVFVDIEGVPTETDPILSQFDGVFICDSDSFYRLYAGIGYDSVETVQSVGVHETLGSKYPIIVANSKLGYQTGGLSGQIINPSSLEVGGKLNREEMVKERKVLEQFLINKKPKVLKDWNGNIWLVFFTDNPSATFDNNWGMGLATISAKWTEIGDANNQDDLQRAGLIGGGV